MAASPGPLPLCLPDPSCLTLTDVSWQGGIMLMIVSATTVGAACPRCGVHSAHIHSRYCRTLRDLPCHGAAVRISINVGMHLIFLHRTDDGLSTHFALENEMPKWKSEGKNKRPIEYLVATEIFDASTSETG